MTPDAQASLSGKTALVTGAASGIGRVTAIELARRGAHVIVSARSPERANPVVDVILAAGGSAEALAMDLASLKSVRHAALELASRHNKLHVLVNNAGLWAGSRQITPDGFEATFAINVLAPFLFTNLLLPALRAARGRVVNVSSLEHYNGRIRWDDLQFERGYGARRAYQQSKLALTMLTNELARREQGLTANSLHPGVIATDLFRNMPAFVQFFIGLLMRSPEDGAQPQIRLAADAGFNDVTGRFFRRFKERPPHKLALDAAACKRLWETCEKLAPSAPAGKPAE
ncbi:MAG: SDR family oxidoreductase [Planctomycetes bacterium]|nr:SDR family oxidoreductase [Planctomycetota bacterium]